MKPTGMKHILLCLSLMVLLCACKNNAVKAVEEKIDGIGEVTELSAGQLAEVREAYDALSERDRKAVSNTERLEKAEAAYDKILAKKVDDLIADIGPIDINSDEKIAAATQEYEKLTDSQKEQVALIGDLISTQKKYASYVYLEADKALDELMNGSGDFDGTAEEAWNYWEKLTEEQKEELKEEKGGDYEEILHTAGISRTERLIGQISYRDGEPDKKALQEMIAAVTAYRELGDSQPEVSVRDDLKKAVKSYQKYYRERDKKDKLYIRRQYIDSCEPLTCAELLKYPDSYKNHKVSVKVSILEIEEAGLLSPGGISAVEYGTKDPFRLRDGREIREPVLSEEDVLTVYGIFEGTETVKIREEGSGFLGIELFDKVKEQYDAPVIRFVYTDEDNLGLIREGNPNAVLPENNDELMDQLYSLAEGLF